MFQIKFVSNPILFLFAFSVLLSSCGASRDAAKSEEGKVEIKDGKRANAPQTYTSLTEYFRRIPGLRVSGDDTNGKVLVMSGAQSLRTSDEPLYVVDGVRIGQSFQSLVRVLNVNDIDRVSVLKSASETSIYGVAGANGVIVIKTKRQ
ncbi:MAG: TonB-dependent receptor plug domain-containing protein [Phaeodactylibacter sp.]|nr:TonB-dependent receptor plug domain-containing protein [Phaeodactylibacter sp.]MCB9300961.1 TonB-dependent receptor plug domain-containing protein [Lewinellaceae bacterium]HQU59140.1 TonB-dependent receptor plug domain-containing protein [Saprospiraceae bacterium]